MGEDPIAVLERELVDAARRRIAGRSKRHRPNLGSLAAALLVGLTLAIAGGALLVLGGHKRLTPSTSVAGRQQLIDILAVLRRPQTKGDLDPKIVSQLSGTPLAALAGTPDLPLVRFATTTPWGEKLYFVPSKPPTASALATLESQSPQSAFYDRPALARILARRASRGETLEMFSSNGGGGDATAADIETGDAFQIEGAGRSFAGGSTETRFISLCQTESPRSRSCCQDNHDQASPAPRPINTARRSRFP